jgi:hypothetical protein
LYAASETICGGIIAIPPPGIWKPMPPAMPPPPPGICMPPAMPPPAPGIWNWKPPMPAGIAIMPPPGICICIPPGNWK